MRQKLFYLFSAKCIFHSYIRNFLEKVKNNIAKAIYQFVSWKAHFFETIAFRVTDFARRFLAWNINSDRHSHLCQYVLSSLTP